MAKSPDNARERKEPLRHPIKVPAFGDMLQALRSGYPKRDGHIGDLSQTELINSLNEDGKKNTKLGPDNSVLARGFSISSGAYSSQENAISLPENPLLEIATLARVLDLNSGEIDLLLKSFALDYLVQKMTPPGRSLTESELEQFVYSYHPLAQTAEERQKFKDDVQKLRNGKVLAEREGATDLYAFRDNVRTDADTQDGRFSQLLSM